MKILATFDESPFSEAIIPTLARLASLPDLEVDLLSIAVITASNSQTTITNDIGRIEAYLEHVTSLLPPGPVYRAWTDTSMYPATTIIEWAKAKRPDLIIMATHGRTGLPRLILGSVAAQVAHAWIAPILLVRPPEDGVPEKTAS